MGEVNAYIQTAMNGAVVSEVLEGMRTFDLIVRLQNDYRENVEGLGRLAITLPEAARSRWAVSRAFMNPAARTQSIASMSVAGL